MRTLLDVYLDEEHGQGHGEVALGPECDVAVTHLQIVEGEHPLTQQLVVVVVHAKP